MLDVNTECFTMYNVLYINENIKVINLYEYLGTNIHHLSKKLLLRQN